MRTHPQHPFSAAAEAGRLWSLPPTKRGLPVPLCPLSQTNEPFRDLRRPTGRKRPKERKDDQGRNDRKPMNRFATCGDPRGEKGQRNAKMTKDEMIGLFKSAPMGSRH